MKTLIVVQARMGSSRLPGKVMLPLAGEPLLVRMLQRVLAASTNPEVVVATTVLPEDQPIRDICRRLSVRCYSGHPTDLLDRHYQAAQGSGPDLVVKIPSDCPLIDPGIIDRVLLYAFDHQGEYDFVSNLHPPTYPDGNDVEVMPLKILETAWREASLTFEREHTTPFIWERPDRFRIANVLWETGLDYSMTHRWTIDYPEDYRFIAAMYERLWTEDRPMFTIRDILALLRHEPELEAINRSLAGVNWYRDHMDKLTTITRDRTRAIDLPHPAQKQE